MKRATPTNIFASLKLYRKRETNVAVWYTPLIARRLYTKYIADTQHLTEKNTNRTPIKSQRLDLQERSKKSSIIARHLLSRQSLFSSTTWDKYLQRTRNDGHIAHRGLLALRYSCIDMNAGRRSLLPTPRPAAISPNAQSQPTYARDLRPVCFPVQTVYANITSHRYHGERAYMRGWVVGRIWLYPRHR